MEERFGFGSETTVRNILHELGWDHVRRKVRPILRPAVMQRRREFCEDMLQRMGKRDGGIATSSQQRKKRTIVIYVDEKWYFCAALGR